MSAVWTRLATVAIGTAMVAGCATGTATSQPAQKSTTSSPAQQQPKTVAIDPAQAARLKNVMIPLLQGMNHPIAPNQVKVGVMDDPHINAANAGGGEFYVTTGLLQKANDDELRAVLAHEMAHADLGHVAKLKTLGAGLNIGMVILDQIIPGSGALTPLAGQLITNKYTQKEEYAADAHGVDILRRAGYDGKTLMVNTLTWLQQTEGTSSGGFFATHPATGDRIQAVQNIK
jgi:Zn-dependent protease with chaperone function